MSRYRCVDAQKATGFAVATACQAARVTRSAYYASDHTPRDRLHALHSTNDYLSPIEWEQQHAIMSPLPSTMAA